MQIVNWKKQNIIEDGCGGEIFKMLSIENSGLKNVEVAMCVFSPGEIARLHYHNIMEEIYYIIEGIGEIEVDGIIYSIQAEDSISIPVKAKHKIKNISETKQLRFLSINSPYWVDDDMIFVDV